MLLLQQLLMKMIMLFGCGVKVDLLKQDNLPNSVSFLRITAVNGTAGFYVGPTWWE
jgi:hypothetical protein